MMYLGTKLVNWDFHGDGNVINRHWSYHIYRFQIVLFINLLENSFVCYHSKICFARIEVIYLLIFENDDKLCT